MNQDIETIVKNCRDFFETNKNYSFPIIFLFLLRKIKVFFLYLWS